MLILILILLLVCCGGTAQTPITGAISVSGHLERPTRTLKQDVSRDNRPVGRIFLTANQCRSESNQGGYIVPNSGSTCISDTSNAATFLSEALAGLNTQLDAMDGMTPRPQGVILWDIDGRQFPTGVFLGHPSVVPLAAPEMDVIADAFIFEITSRGYKVGLTLRPTRLRIGQSLPPCHGQLPSDGRWLHFITLEFSYTNRAKKCNQSTFAWDPSPEGVHDWFSAKNEAVEELAKEVLYAVTRWGASIFYVDSTGYIPVGASTTTLLDGEVWAELHRRFPAVQFYPENVARRRDVSRYALDYTDDPNSWAPGYAGEVHPIAAVVGTPTWDAGVQDTLAAFIRAGSILLFDPWHSTQRNEVAAAYAQAGY